MRQLTINPDNRQYYSEDFIKGFNCGAHRQFEADKSDADRRQGEWKRRLVDNGFNADWVCSECGYRVKTDFVSFNFCPHCGARMKGADDECR